MNRTREYCMRFIEGACLLMLIIVPIFLNMFSSRVFDPDKVAILRSLALSAVVIAFISMVLRIVEQPAVAFFPGQWLRNAVKTPLVVPIVLFAVVTIISTVFAISPRTSFWGSYLRLQGTYTTFAYLVLVGGLVYAVRDWRQVERVARVIVLTSVPVALYGIAQKFGSDFTTWNASEPHRIVCTLGNPIFVGAYFIMVIPLAVRQLLLAFAVLRRDPEHQAVNSLLCLSHGAIVVVQVTALVMSGSRGPMLGGMLGFTLFATLYLLWQRRRWLALVVMLVPFLVGLMVVLNQTKGSHVNRTRGSNNRYERLLDMKEKNSQVRIIIWRGIVELMGSNPVLGNPDVETDSLHAIRPVVGFGPESMVSVFSKVYPPELGRYEDRRTKMADRAHCETWNVLLETGILGLIAYFLLFGTIFHHAFRCLGLVRDRSRSLLFAGCCVLGALAAATVLVLKWGIVFLGPAVPLGMVCGIYLYIWVVAFLDGPEVCPFKHNMVVYSMVAAIVSSLLAHFVDIQVGIPTVTSRICFWAMIALLLLVSRLSRGPEAEIAKATQEVRFRRGDVWGWGLLAAVMLATVAYDVVVNMKSLTSTWDFLKSVYGFRNGTVMVVASVLVCGVPVLWGMCGGKLRPVAGYFLGVVCIGAGAAAVFSIIQAMAQAWLSRAVFPDVAGLIDRERCVEMLATIYYLFILVVLPLLGVALCDAGKWKWKDLRSCIGCVVVFLCMAVPLAYGTNLRLMHADICSKPAHAHAVKGNVKEASGLYARVLSLDPVEERGYISYAEDLFALAKTQEKPLSRERMLDKASHLLSQAQVLAPYKYEIVADLALVYCWWATVTTDPMTMAARGRISDKYYEQVLALSPNHVNFWTERAFLNIRVLNNPQAAEKYLLQAIQLDPEYSWPRKIAGDHYYLLGKAATDPEAVAAAFKKAVFQYGEALRTLKKSDPVSRAECDLGIGRILAETGNTGDAIERVGKAYRGAAEKDKPGIRKFLDSLESKQTPDDKGGEQ